MKMITLIWLFLSISISLIQLLVVTQPDWIVNGQNVLVSSFKRFTHRNIFPNKFIAGSIRGMLPIRLRSAAILVLDGLRCSYFGKCLFLPVDSPSLLRVLPEEQAALL